MDIRNKIFSRHFFRSIIILFMMGWADGASLWAQSSESQVEALLYHTDFQNWDSVSHLKATNEIVNRQTTDYQTFSFTFNGVGITKKLINTKFPDYKGFMLIAKYPGEYKTKKPTAVTSALASITKLSLIQVATGRKRGVKVSVKGDGDTDWVVLHNDSIRNPKGETLNLDVNRTNCQIKFENYDNSLNQNAYIADLTIYGYTSLASITSTNSITNPDQAKYPKEKAENAGVVTITKKTTQSSAEKDNEYLKGDVVTITATPKEEYTLEKITVNGADYTSFPFDYTITKNTNNVVAYFTRKTLHKVTVRAGNGVLGSVSLSPADNPNFYSETRTTASASSKDSYVIQAECWYAEGTEVTATATPITDYIIDKWTDENGKELSPVTEDKDNHTYAYAFPINAQSAVVNTFNVQFKQGNLGNVIFTFDGAMVNGASVASEYKDALSILPDPITGVRSFTIPTNFTFFRGVNDDGTDDESYTFYSLKYWYLQDDPTKHYELGKSYMFSQPNETLTLVPKFERNPTSFENRTTSSVIRYDFTRKLQAYDDPTSNTTRNVAAQSVNIGNNEHVYWTSQVYVNVLQGGDLKNHWRDVALSCDTGEKGYIRNQDFDDWCAFGPGTTFWAPSTTNAKISILTYAPITTTTIDGAVPTLDQERTAAVRKELGFDHLYIYSHTTQSSEEYIPIVIGDDYSYYKWIEEDTPEANWVNLHVSVNEEARGVIDKVEPATSGNAMENLDDGGYAFHMSERVKVTFHRKKGYELEEIVGIDKTDVNGNPNYTLTATESKTSYNAEDSIRTQYVLEFTMAGHTQLELKFKEKEQTYYITYNPGQFAVGTPPEAEWVEAGDLFEVPRNQTLYYEGNTLDHWVDEDGNSYATNSRPAAPAKNLRMFPVFRPNDFNLLDLQQDATATWYFAKNDGAPTINYEKTKGILVTQLTTQVDNVEQSIDLKIDLDATTNSAGNNGKFNNVDGSTPRPERIQINANSIIVFPSTPQCHAKLVTTETSTKTIKIAGQTKTTQKLSQNDNHQVADADCSGESATQEAEFLEGIYSRYFSVTYKKQTAAQTVIETLTCSDGKGYTKTFNKAEIDAQMNANNCVTFTGIAPWENNEAMPEVTGTATQGGTVTATKATLSTKECAVTVKNSAGVTVATYPVKFQFATPDTPPVFEQITVNGQTYTSTTNDIKDVPRSGVIRVKFSRTMQAPTIIYDGLTYIANSDDRELVFKYWDMKAGSTVQLVVKHEEGIFKDIYGVSCQEDLVLTLHIATEENLYHHHQFDFIVGKDGDIDEAIKAANGEATGKTYNNKKTDGHRYFIFVPDGEYQLSGNTIISYDTSKEDNELPKDENGNPRKDMSGKNNGITDIRKPNVSLIGQSKEGVTLYNHPVIEGISYTATINLRNDAQDFYAQDLTLENQFNYWGTMTSQGSGGAGRAVAFADHSNRTVLKNVAMWSWQDTYYSTRSSDATDPDFRGYFEDCDLAGAVDWICGNGDFWFERCNLIVRDRRGNNIVAPRTMEQQAWGYVFNNCSIKAETENPIRFSGEDWTLARPWGESPACTFLNTRMYTKPRNYGWGRMGGGEFKLRFHEYHSIDGNGNPLSLSTRSLAACTPAAGSDDCVLTDPSDYTIRNVLSGTDAYEPHKLCQQINAKQTTPSTVAAEDVDGVEPIEWDAQLELDDEVLNWKSIQEALCYFIFKRDEQTGKWIYQDNTTESSINLNNFGTGYFCVRAANQRGGLGLATPAVQYVVSDPYELEIKQVGDVEGYGWTTICLPFNAKKPSEVTVYAATADDKGEDDEKLVTDFTLNLWEVNAIDRQKGYIVYGPVGKHTFLPTSSSCEKKTILKGNATSSAIAATNISCYIMANKTWGLGFYKFAGSTLAAYRAWLPQNMVGDDNQLSLSSGKKAIRFKFADGTTSVRLPSSAGNGAAEDIYYNLSGQRMEKPTQPGIYISRQKGKFVKK